MAPEMLEQKVYTYSVDWWALGVLTYEFIVGFPPFATFQEGWQDNIKHQEVMFPNAAENGIEMSDLCRDFIQRCLAKEDAQRLGSQHDVDEVLQHPWLADIDREQLLSKSLPAEYQPYLSDDLLDVSYFDQTVTTQQIQESILS